MICPFYLIFRNRHPVATFRFEVFIKIVVRTSTVAPVLDVPGCLAFLGVANTIHDFDGTKRCMPNLRGFWFQLSQDVPGNHTCDS